MDISIIIIVVGIIAAIYDIVKKQAKEADRKAKRQRVNTNNPEPKQRSFIDKLETYIERAEKEYSNKAKPQVYNKHKRTSETKVRTETKQEVYREERPKVNIPKVKTKPKMEYNLNSQGLEEKSKVKRNPFEVTKNPVANAVIASEILGKPKCKR